MATNKPNNGLDIEYTRDASIRATEIFFIDPRVDIGGMVVVTDKWLRKRNLSLERNGMIYHTLMTIFSAFWTNTIREANLSYFHWAPPHKLIDGVDIVGWRK